MEYVRSCGFVAYKQIDDDVCYLIIKSVGGDVGFPKGHMEIGENELETAIRELKEETNVEVEVVPNFRRAIEYPLLRKPNIMKQSVYFLGKCKNDKIICQESEILEANFVSYEKAIELLTFEETKAVLKDARQFINRNKLA